MTVEQGSILLPAPRQLVRDALLRPLEMPEWNPAFRSVAGPLEPAVGARYALKTTHGFSGSLWYEAISEDRIDMSWTVPGFTEHGTWELRDAMYGTAVRHQFAHAGPLAAVLRFAYRGVADLRLQRLATRVRADVSRGHAQ